MSINFKFDIKIYIFNDKYQKKMCDYDNFTILTTSNGYDFNHLSNCVIKYFQLKFT